MAIDPRDIPITRDQVAGWLNIHRNLPKSNKKPMKDFLADRVKAANLEGADVNTSSHHSMKESTPLVDIILMDIKSYGYDEE